MNCKIIMATDITYGIGKNGILPWKYKEDLAFFKSKTINKIIVFGKKTLEKLPKLKSRRIFCMTTKYIQKREELVGVNECTLINSIKEIPKILDIENLGIGKIDIWIAGGAEIYNHVMREYINNISKLYITLIQSDYHCDVHLDVSLLVDLFENMDGKIVQKNKEFTIYKYSKNNKE